MKLFPNTILKHKSNWINWIIRIWERTVLVNVFIYSSIQFQIFVEWSLEVGNEFRQWTKEGIWSLSFGKLHSERQVLDKYCSNSKNWDNTIGNKCRMFEKHSWVALYWFNLLVITDWMGKKEGSKPLNHLECVLVGHSSFVSCLSPVPAACIPVPSSSSVLLCAHATGSYILYC